MFDNDNRGSDIKKNELIPKAIMTMNPVLGVQCILSRLRGEKDYYETVSTACHAMAVETYRKHIETLEILIEECLITGALKREHNELVDKLERLLDEAEAKGYIV